MDMTIRRAESGDSAGFAAVANEVHEHHVAVIPGVFLSAPAAVWQGYFESLISADETEIWVAEYNGEIAGYAVLQQRRTAGPMHAPRTFSFIDNFGVAKAYRRKGVARQLFEACVAVARERGDTTLELDCWEANQGALRFYEAMGMKTTRRRLALDL